MFYLFFFIIFCIIMGVLAFLHYIVVKGGKQKMGIEIQNVGMPTTSGVPRRSPIQVLTGPNVA